MKLLKNIIDKQSNNPDLILSWLCWIEDHCFGRLCNDCLYGKLFKGEMNCEIHQVYKKAFPGTSYRYVFPSYWRIPSSSIGKIQPPSLDFLTKIRWSEQGFPDVRGAENETY